MARVYLKYLAVFHLIGLTKDYVMIVLYLMMLAIICSKNDTLLKLDDI